LGCNSVEAAAAAKELNPIPIEGKKTPKS